MVERAQQAVVLFFAVVARDVGGHVRLMEDAREIEAARLPVVDARAHVEQVGAADQIVDAADAELRHQLARFLGDEEQEIDDVLGLARELLAQLRILRGDADRAGIQMALAHHDAALGDQRRRGESEFVGTEQRADDHIAPGLHLAVDLHRDAAAQAIQDQRLLRFRQAEFPRRPGVLDRRFRRGARAAVVAGDRDVIGLGLRHARGDRPDADFGHQLDADRRLRIRVLQIVDQLRQILDRIDVVMRRRRNQADTRHRVAQFRDVLRDLVPRQLAAFARLRALRHLDLQLVRIDQVFGGDAEARGRDLLDLRAQRIALLAPARRRRRCRCATSASRPCGSAHSDAHPRRLRPCSTCRRCGSSPRRAWCAPRSRSNPGSSRRSRSA